MMDFFHFSSRSAAHWDEVPTSGSASMRITFVPRWRNSVARLVAMVDFPVPPL